MVGSGLHHRFSESLPLQARAKRDVLGPVRSRLPVLLHVATAPGRMGGGKHKLRGHRARRPRLCDGIHHIPIHSDDDSRVPRGRAALPGAPGPTLE